MSRAVVFIAALASSAATAADAREEASRHFRLGVQLAGEADYLGAAVEFKRAYDIAPQFAVLYNLGQAYVGAGRPVEAVDALERYLKDGGRNLPPARQREVAETIRLQTARIGSVAVRVSPDGAVIRVDGRDAGKAPLAAPLRVAVGEHTVVVTAEGRRTETRTVAVAAGEQVNLEVKLESDAPPPAPVAEVTPPPVEPKVEPAPPPPVVSTPPVAAEPATPPRNEVPPRRGGALRVAAWVTTIAGLAALGGGLIAGILTIEPYRAEQLAKDLQTYNAAKEQADRAALAANIMYGIGGALAVAGLVLLIVSWPTADDVSAGVFPAVGGGGVWVGFRL